MLSKKLRTNTHEVTQTLQKGRLYHAGHILLRVCPHTETKIGFVVPKKLKLSSVERNTLRRRGYETISPLLHRIRDTYLLLFFFKKGAEELPPNEIKKELQELLDKLTESGYNTR